MVAWSSMVEQPESEDEGDFVTVRGRSFSAPPRVTFEEDAAKQQKHITTIVDGAQTVNGEWVAPRYRTQISSMAGDEDSSESSYQIVRVAESSHVYVQAPPPSPNTVEPSFVYPFPSPTVNESSSWVENRNNSPWVAPDRVGRNTPFAPGEPAESPSFSPFAPRYGLESSLEYTPTSQNTPGFDDSSALGYDRWAFSDPGTPRHGYFPRLHNHFERTHEAQFLGVHTESTDTARDETRDSTTSIGMSGGYGPTSTSQLDSSSTYAGEDSRTEDAATPSSYLDQDNGLAFSSGNDAEVESNDTYTPTETESNTLCEQQFIRATGDDRLNRTQGQESSASIIQTFPAIDAKIPPLSTHLLDMFASGKYSDVQIVLTSASRAFYTITFNVHRAIISQIPILESILQYQEITLEKSSTIHIKAAEKFSMARAFGFVLENMYGQALISMGNVNELTHGALGYDHYMNNGGQRLSMEKIRELGMDLALCYGTTGVFLNIMSFVNAGFGLAIELLDWGNLETALHFAVYPEDFLLTYEVDKMNKAKSRRVKRWGKNNKDNSKDNNNKTDKTYTNADLPPSIVHTVQIIQTWSAWVSSAAIRFLIGNLPATFHFDRTALSKASKTRIPHHLRTDYSIANLNPMLASLTFGQHPQPSPTCTHASAILLALPYTQFHEAIDVMRQKGILTAELIKAILQEREERRLSALWEYAKQTTSSSENMDIKEKKEVDTPDYLKELCYREFAIHVQTHDAGAAGHTDGNGVRDEFTLHREWKGYQANQYGEPVIRKFGVN